MNAVLYILTFFFLLMFYTYPLWRCLLGKQNGILNIWLTFIKDDNS